MWNIQGLNSSAFGLKSLNTEFQKSIKEMDIIILQETWSRADAITHCPPNYRETILPSQKLSTVRQGRDSGGQIIWYKSKFHNHINTVKQGICFTWLKIHKELLSSRKDIFLCAIYIPPSESPYYSEDMFSTLEEETNHFQAQGNVLICGDLYARTGLQPDFTDTQGSKYINNKLTVINNTFSHIHRNNHDHTVNKNGKDLLQLCRSLGLYIINGRLRGDTLGRFTFCTPLGNSTVDYMITDIDPSSLRSFTVRELTPLSDHSQITAYLKKTENNINTKPSKLYNIRKPYRWAENCAEEYQKALSSQKIQALIDNFLNNTYAHTNEGVNLAVKDINYIFEKSAKIYNLKTKNGQNQILKTDKNWFDQTCQTIRKNLRTLSNQKHNDPNNAEIRHFYCATLKQYKHTLRTKKAQYTQKQLTIIEKSVNTNQFWDNWNNLKKTDHEELPIQNGEIWESHFQTLFNKVQTDTNCEQNQTINQVEKLELTIKDNQNPLDFPITDKELKEKIKNLQLQKASGPNGILNEMIKHTSSKLQLAVLKLFNVILRVGYFPDIWNQGLITPIFKNGDKFDPNNYRGICVSSNLGKLFCSIINARLLDFITTHNVLSRSQIGFLPNYRTSDHIYTLHTLIEQHVHQDKGKIYECFIDFKKSV